jgi:integrase
MLADGGNLWLQLTRASNGGINKSWVLRYTVGGDQREMGLGSYSSDPSVTLDAARRKASECRELLKQGIDPLDQREELKSKKRAEAAKDVTFDQLLDRYLEIVDRPHRSERRSEKYRKQWEAALRQHISPKLGKTQVRHINREAMIAALDPIWHAKPATAAVLRSRVEKLMDWAAARGLRDRNEENPARRQLIEAGLVKHDWNRRHHPALPHRKVPEFIALLRAREGIPYRCIEFLTLTACRSSEARSAVWAEIDLDLKSWTIPGTRMKSGRLHRIPLSPPALRLLQKMWDIRSGDLIFPNRDRRPMSDTTLTKGALSHLKLRDDEGLPITIHGMRSAFRDWAAERTTFPNEVCEQALAHNVGNQTEAAYRRGDMFERRVPLMEQWGAFCDGAPAAAANVIPITA